MRAQETEHNLIKLRAYFLNILGPLERHMSFLLKMESQEAKELSFTARKKDDNCIKDIGF